MIDKFIDKFGEVIVTCGFIILFSYIYYQEGIFTERIKWCKHTYEKHVELEMCEVTPDWEKK